MARTKLDARLAGARSGKAPRKQTVGKAPRKDAATKAVAKLFNRHQEEIELKKAYRHRREFMRTRRFKQASRDSRAVFSYANRVRQVGQAMALARQTNRLSEPTRITREAVEMALVSVNSNLRLIFKDASAVLRSQGRCTLDGKTFVDRVNNYSQYKDLELIGEVEMLMRDAGTPAMSHAYWKC